MKIQISLSVLLISLLAVGAYAQTQSEPVKGQTRQDGSEVAQNPGTSTTNQNYVNYEAVGGPHDPSGPAGMTAEGDAIQGDKILDVDKIGDQPQTGEPVKGQTRQDGSEIAQNPGTSTANQNYVDHEAVGGPHEPSGLAGTTAEGDAIQGDKILGDNADGTFAGDMLQYNWGPGTGEGGPVGPNDGSGFGPAGCDAANGEDLAKSARGQARAGRR